MKNELTISKAQLEVWEWKHTLHEEIKDMPLEEGIRYILEKGASVRKELYASGKRPSSSRKKGL